MHYHLLISIVLSIPACLAGDQVSIPRRGEIVYSMVAQWLSLLPHSKKVLDLSPGQGLSVWSLLVLPMFV